MTVGSGGLVTDDASRGENVRRQVTRGWFTTRHVVLGDHHVLTSRSRRPIFVSPFPVNALPTAREPSP